MKVSLQISPTSLAAFNANLTTTQEVVTGAAQTGFSDVSSKLFYKVLNNTPRKTGSLAKSGKLSTETTASLLRSVISFGDATANPQNGKKTSEYAVIVHEVYREAHPASYKWLERTVNSYASESMINDLAAAIQSALR